MDTALHRYRYLIGQSLLTNQHRSVMNDVVMQVLPLRADMATLRRFIDSYLNFVDDEVPPPFYFKPAAPMVLLELLHYPYLAVPTRNLSAYSQHELSFVVPLECYANEGGISVFKGFAICSPFIYLARLASIVSGRQLFGIPKIDCSFEAIHASDDPGAATQMLDLGLRVQSPGGDNYVSFIEFWRDPRPYSSPRRAMSEAIRAYPNRVADLHELIVSAWENWAQMPLSGFDGIRDLHSTVAMSQAGLGAASNAYSRVFPFRFAPMPYSSTADYPLAPNYIDLITIKENRDAQYTQSACFQAIVRSTMYFDRLIDGGPLFDTMGRSGLSDVTVAIHKIEGQRLVDALGLEVESVISAGQSPAAGYSPGGAQQKAAADEIYSIRPVLPYWLKADLTYGLGTNLYWRSTNTDWSFDELPGAPVKEKNSYVAFGGGAGLEDPTYLVAPEGNVWIWPLPIDKDPGADGLSPKDRLADHCRCYLRNDYFDFQLCGEDKVSDFVYLILRNVNNTASGRGPVWEEQLTFAVFVDMYDKASGEFVGTLLFPIYALTDNESRDVTNSEVYGVECDLAQFKVEGADWTQQNVTAPFDHTLLTRVNVYSTVLPTVFEGGAPQRRLLVSLMPYQSVPPANFAPPVFVETLPRSKAAPHAVPTDSSAAKFQTLKAMLRDTSTTTTHGPRMGLVKELPPPNQNVVTVSLKQVMDCRFPERASYQAIVLDALKVAQRDPRGGHFHKGFAVQVGICRYDSVPLVETLGLKTYPRVSQDTTVDISQPRLGYRFKAPIEEKGAVVLARREGAGSWELQQRWKIDFEKKAPGVIGDLKKLKSYLTASLIS